jgi:NAD(P)-dependent dehydrogenase (short-subunit alcohol dehydrogenase family)
VTAPEPLRFDGQTALVTGAASGIGAAAARLLAARGAQVLLCDSNAAGVAQVAAALGQAWHAADVSQPPEVRALREWAQARAARLHVVVHSAGIEGPTLNLLDLPLEDFDEVVAVNLRGTFLVMQALLGWMATTGGGALVNVASPLGLVGAPGAAAYCASKGGVIQLTKVAAIEYSQRGLRVNCVCPGIVDTPMTARGLAETGPLERYDNLLQRMASAEEIAETILFLASPAASFIVGSALIVDGGKLTW